jgi:hypothetical protein
MARMIHAAPVLGVPAWIVAMYLGNSYFILFTPGLFMLATGLLVPAVAWRRARSTPLWPDVRSALRFHGIVGLVVIAFAIAFLVAVQFDPANPTLSNPPASMQAVMTVFFASATFLLPFVELGRAVYGIATVGSR